MYLSLIRVRHQAVVPLGVCQSKGLSELAQEGNCEYYPCLEGAVQCKEDGYPSGYGHRYCTRIDSQITRLTDKVITDYMVNLKI